MPPLRTALAAACLVLIAACPPPKRELLTEPDPTVPADVAAPPKDAQVTPSGLATKIISPGNGFDSPGPDDTVTVHYTGWTTDGHKFDSSRDRGRPSTFPLDAVIEGWREGLQLMVPGERRMMWIPEQLAYKGAPNKPKGMLVFDVELLGFQSAEEEE